jgi:hypothetical protein
MLFMPQFFCLLKPICIKFPWIFLLMLIAIGLCAFNCMSHFISQSLYSFTQVATQNLVQIMLFLCQCCFTSSRPWLFMMTLRDFRNMLPISNNKQWTAGNPDLPGLSGCHESFLCWIPLYPLWSCFLQTLSHFVSWGSRLLSTINLMLALVVTPHLFILCHSFISTTSIFQFSTIVFCMYSMFKSSIFSPD